MFRSIIIILMAFRRFILIAAFDPAQDLNAQMGYRADQDPDAEKNRFVKDHRPESMVHVPAHTLIRITGQVASHIFPVPPNLISQPTTLM